MSSMPTTTPSLDTALDNALDTATDLHDTIAHTAELLGRHTAAVLDHEQALADAEATLAERRALLLVADPPIIMGKNEMQREAELVARTEEARALAQRARQELTIAKGERAQAEYHYRATIAQAQLIGSVLQALGSASPHPPA